MNILIIGCGKVGSQLANLLDRQGHDIVIIDQYQENFDFLESSFHGYRISGYPIDQDVLRKAGIESCDVIASVTRDDNVNIMVSEIASEIFNVKNIITRIYDPNRENIFAKFGLKTICPTNMTVSAICSSINHESSTQEISFDNTSISFSIVSVPKKYINKTVSSIISESDGDEILFGVISDNKFIFSQNYKFNLKESDKLIFSRIIN